MLGHKSATMTLDLYGHLFPDQLDQVADALDNAMRALADVYPSCTKADVVDLETWRQDPTANEYRNYMEWRRGDSNP